jgi:hypothetical protein
MASAHLISVMPAPSHPSPLVILLESTAPLSGTRHPPRRPRHGAAQGSDGGRGCRWPPRGHVAVAPGSSRLLPRGPAGPRSPCGLLGSPSGTRVRRLKVPARIGSTLSRIGGAHAAEAATRQCPPASRTRRTLAAAELGQWTSRIEQPQQGRRSGRRSLPRWVLDPNAPSRQVTRASCARPQGAGIRGPRFCAPRVLRFFPTR